jgi:transglutaminase-like putative cysteine protease
VSARAPAATVVLGTGGGAPAPAAPRAADAPTRAFELRVVAFVALALFGMLHWAALVDPAAPGAAGAVVAAGTGAALVLAGLAGAPTRATAASGWWWGGVRVRPRLTGRRRAVAAGFLVVALLTIAFLAAGVPGRLLLPDAWDDLAAGIVQGLEGMPGVSVPYRGADEWISIAILLGGTLLVCLAALLAFWHRRGTRSLPSALPAAVALSVLYAVPIVEHPPDRPFLGGAAFCLLLAAFLWLERLGADQVGIGALLVAVATVAGLVVAPLLDGDGPWLDYESLAQDLEPKGASTFDWNHDYGPLSWPRDGREILRVKAEASAYWKATSLDRFDGVRWREGRLTWTLGPDIEQGAGRPEWFQTVRVVHRGLSSSHFIAPGTTLAILPPAPDAVRALPGTFRPEDGILERGASYRARAYSPRPSEIDMRSAGLDYPLLARDHLEIELPQHLVRRRIIDPGRYTQDLLRKVTLRFAPFGTDSAPRGAFPSGYQVIDAGAYLRRSAYARVYALARRLRAASGASPYDFVLRVQDRVQRGALYSEAAIARRVPLSSFLFEDRIGYCQQFSGAMALLLRMGGVPARVASGFTPGRYDRKRKEYVVRDLDAHSWVEVYFPQIGWVTFDPTPAASPARSQSDDAADPGAPDLGGEGAAAGDRLSDPGAGGAVADDGGSRTGLVAAGFAVLVALAAGGVTLVRRGRLPGEPLGPEVAELQRALHRTGRTPAPDVTLARLEGFLSGSSAAQRYVRAVRAARFAGRGAGPTPADRRALRAELAAGLGWRGRLRALWALPPRPPDRRRRA